MIIIPDVHGRSFWKKAVLNHENEDIIFLGDYLDPYSHEGITREDAIATLYEIIAFKRAHPGNVTLLLGNHDLGYISPDINECRRDYEHYNELHKLLNDNAKLFQLCTSREIHGKTYFFSHSFLHKEWLEACKKYLGFDYAHPSELADILNDKYRDEKEKMCFLLAAVSFFRGGTLRYGSMVWSDIMETFSSNAFVEGIYNVFGHTQNKRPLIADNFACIDTHRAFELHTDGILAQIGD